MNKLLKPLGNGKKILTEDEVLKEIEGAPVGNADSNPVFQPLSSNESLDRLVFATYGEIYCIKDKRIFSIVNRLSWVTALAVFENKLYDGGEDGDIYDTLLNAKLAKRNTSAVHDFAVFENKLYEARGDHSIYETFSTKKIATRTAPVRALAVFNNKLYDAGDYNAVCETLSGKMITIRKYRINALGVFGNKLYESVDDCVIYETFSGKEIRRPISTSVDFVVLNNRLYDGGHNKGVYDTLNDPEGKYPVLSVKPKIITAMCAVSAELLNKLVGNAKEVGEVR